VSAGPERRTGGAIRRSREPSEARREFPYHWDADEFVARRELLRLAVLTSGALFAATVAIAVRGAFGGKTHAERQEIAKASDVPPGTAHYFNYPTKDDQAVLVNIPGQGFVAYSQKCTHLSCAVRYEAGRNRLFCPCHEGVFSLSTGDPTAGPPQRRLPRILLDQRGDTLFAIERQL
jgi:nitrite reductase/ring-hydroxylating ferredoxin subunit